MSKINWCFDVEFMLNENRDTEVSNLCILYIYENERISKPWWKEFKWQEYAQKGLATCHGIYVFLNFNTRNWYLLEVTNIFDDDYKWMKARDINTTQIGCKSTLK